MRKILALIIMIFLLTGCSVNYNLTINEDLTINEEVNMTGTSEFFSVYNKTSKLNVIKMMLDTDDKTLLENNNYSISIVEDDTPYVKASKTFDDIVDYTNNNVFFKQYFDKIDYSINGDVVKITTSGFNPNDPEDPGRYYVRDLNITITSKYKVLEHNASSVNKKTNTYHWTIKDTTEDFELLFSFDNKTKFNPYINMYIGIVISIIVIIVTWVVVWYLDKNDKKKKKKNKR